MAGFLWPLLTLIQSRVLYAFAELLQTAKEINSTLKIGYAENISEKAEQRQRMMEKGTSQTGNTRLVRRRKRDNRQKKGSVAEAAKQARIIAYWREHPTEETALREKQAPAQSKLKGIGGLAGKQREALQELICSIDEEMNREREG